MITITSMVNNMNGFFQLKRSEEALYKASEQLSSFQRINSAKDDPAGLSISTGMSSDIREKNQSIRNANDAISLTQVADSAVGNASDILLRVRELAVQAGNGTLSADNKTTIENEINQLTSQLSDIGKNTTFNGINVFDNSQSLNIQIGFNDSISLDLSELANLTNDSDDPNNTDISLSSAGSSDELLTNIDNVLSQMNDTRSRLGATQSRFSTAIEGLSAQIVQTEQSRSQIRDADYAQTIADFLQAKLSNQASSSVFIKANDSDRTFINSLLSGN